MSAAVSAETSAAASAATPSRLCSALDRPPCRGVSHLELHPPHVNFIIVRALFEGLGALARIVRDLFEGGKKYGISFCSYIDPERSGFSSIPEKCEL